MRIILNVLEILLLSVTVAVVVSYVIRRYELGNTADEAARHEATAAERALGVAGEVAASFLCLLLYPFGLIMREPPPAELRPGERPVILCHGYLHNRSAFFVLRSRLGRAGWNNVITPNFGPASASIPEFARQLEERARLAMELAGSDDVDLVGHSMGGLVVRYFIERLGGASCVRTAVTVGAPHRGTKTAALGLFKTAEQFRPGSPLVGELNAASSLANMVSVWSEFDNIILPPENAMLPEPSRNVMVRNVGHVAMLFSGQVFNHVSRALSDGGTG